MLIGDKTLIGIPPKHIYYAMLFGVPSVQYPCTVQRDNAAIVRHVKI